MFPLKEIIRSQSKMYALSRAVERSAYLIAPMPTSSAIASRSRLSSSRSTSSRIARARSTPSVSRSLSLTLSPALVRSRWPSLPWTMPICACSKSLSAGSQPAFLATAKTTGNAGPGRSRRRKSRGRRSSYPSGTYRGQVGGGVIIAAVALADDHRQRVPVPVGEPFRKAHSAPSLIRARPLAMRSSATPGSRSL